MDWEVYPQGLTETLRWLDQRYGKVPLYITENGAAIEDVVAPKGRVDDTRRVEYLHSHLRAAKEAIGTGVDLRSYFVWSLLDSFRVAIRAFLSDSVSCVDFETQQRVPKASAQFYSDVIRTNGGAIGG